jgi:hypothetical protein
MALLLALALIPSIDIVADSLDSLWFVPEGQHDRSQARSAWNHKENSPSQRDD